ncbi:MAG: hypothetical protein ACXV3S_02200, partial [Kineosporiaceae bacterium]
MTGSPPEITARRVELLAVLSLGADLGLGQPMEHVLRECLIAMRLAERVGLEARARAVVCYTALLTWVGCHVDAYEQAKWFGDDLAFKSDFPRVDGAGPGFVLRHLGAGRSLPDRARLGVAFLGAGRRDVAAILDNHRRAAEGLVGARPSATAPSRTIRTSRPITSSWRSRLPNAPCATWEAATA